MKRLLLFLVILWGGGAVGYWYWNEARARPVEFRTVRVERGDLRLTIEANGTLEPVEVVDVGAQVAGLIQSFGEDPRGQGKPISYGSPVKEGTILARLDDALFKARVDQTRAQLDRAKADVQQAKAGLWQAERELERNRNLRSRSGAVSAQEYEAAQAEVETARAGVAVAEGSVGLAEANLEEARVNLGYTTIRSPVAGVILDRRVNIGQTVVASLNAPSLFLIAKDLSRMEIWASVNEADIGAINVGHPARFTVAPFPDKDFLGKVSQIRLNASMVHNVVTYTVVIDVDNADGKLLPYLTARVQFQVDERPRVLLVPNVALRFRPGAGFIAPASPSPRPDPSAGGPGSVGDPAGERTATGSRTRGSLWVRQGDFVRPVSVQVGPTDGLRTEVTGEGLAEGQDVVIGQRLRDVGAASPFLPNFGKSARNR